MKKRLNTIEKKTIKPRKFHVPTNMSSKHARTTFRKPTAFCSPICRLPAPNFMVCARAFATRFGALLLPCFWWHAYSMLVATKWMELKKVTLEKKSSDSPEHPTLRNEL